MSSVFSPQKNMPRIFGLDLWSALTPPRHVKIEPDPATGRVHSRPSPKPQKQAGGKLNFLIARDPFWRSPSMENSRKRDKEMKVRYSKEKRREEGRARAKESKTQAKAAKAQDREFPLPASEP